MRKLATLILISMSVVCPCLAESFSLRSDKTKELYGPFDFQTGSTVTISRTSFTIVKESSGTREMEGRLKSIVIPMIDFRYASLKDALNYIEGTLKSNPKGKGINIILNAPKETKRTSAAKDDPFADLDVDLMSDDETRVDLRLRNYPLYSLFKRLGEQTGYRFKTEDHTVIFFVPEKPSVHPHYVESFLLKSHITQKTHGPFDYEDGSKVRIGRTSLTIVAQEAGVSQLESRLKKITIPEVEFRQAHPLDCLEFLREFDRNGQGVIIVCLQKDFDFEKQLVTLSKTDISSYDLLNEIVKRAGCRYKVMDNTVIVYEAPKQ